jgi:hypothetical protein
LKSHPHELKRFVEHCKGENVNVNYSVDQSPESETLTANLFHEAEVCNLATFPGHKPEPFYVSLYINGCRLNNCIIDSGASDNVMPYPVAKALGLTLTKAHGKCYSMDAKQVPLLGQIKDAQVALALHPEKKLLLTILVADIPASYGLLLSRSFCRDLGGEIKLDWSQATIPIGNKKVKLEPEEKAKFTVLKSDDPKAQILYQELEFGNYMLYTVDSADEDETEVVKSENPEENNEPQIWTLEFDGSCSSSGSGAGIVLIPPEGEPEPLAFKLEFGNTNNTVEYEALLLGIVAAKERGVKILKARGDAELIVRQVRGQYFVKNHKL